MERHHLHWPCLLWIAGCAGLRHGHHLHCGICCGSLRQGQLQRRGTSGRVSGISAGVVPGGVVRTARVMVMSSGSWSITARRRQQERGSGRYQLPSSMSLTGRQAGRKNCATILCMLCRCSYSLCLYLSLSHTHTSFLFFFLSSLFLFHSPRALSFSLGLTLKFRRQPAAPKEGRGLAAFA